MKFLSSMRILRFLFKGSNLKLGDSSMSKRKVHDLHTQGPEFNSLEALSGVLMALLGGTVGSEQHYFVGPKYRTLCMFGQVSGNSPWLS